MANHKKSEKKSGHKKAATGAPAGGNAVTKEDDYGDYTDAIPSNTPLESHFTPRDPDRKAARLAALRRQIRSGGAAVATGGRKVSDGLRSVVRKKTAKTRTVQAEKSGKTGASGKKTMTVLIAAVCVLLVVLAGAAVTVRALYTSKTFLSGGEDLDKNVIQERLITEEQNRDKVTYFLIVGVDKSSLLTDCIWIMCFDNEAHKMNVMQIPRDTYVGSDSVYPHKINAVYASPQTVRWCEKCGRAVTSDEIRQKKHTVCGTEVTKRTESNINALIRCINNRLSLPIDHYVLFDFTGFEKVIDALGGVDIVLEEEMKVYPSSKKQYIVLPAGENHLDGKTALKFMRNRKIYIEGDLGRVRAQRRIIHAMMEKVTSMSTLETLGVLKAAYGNFSTDMSLEEIRSFIAPVKKCDPDSLHMFEMPGTDHWVKPNPSYYVCSENQTLEVINEYMVPYSEPLTEEDIRFPRPVD